MQKLLALTILGIALAASMSTDAQEPDLRETNQTAFLQANKWWNFYFETHHNPLGRGDRSIHAVKVLATDSLRPSWVKITFPKSREEHISIFGPAAGASEDESITLDAALAKWEEGISEWKTMWVNLRFVARITRVEQAGDGDGE